MKKEYFLGNVSYTYRLRGSQKRNSAAKKAAEKELKKLRETKKKKTV